MCEIFKMNECLIFIPLFLKENTITEYDLIWMLICEDMNIDYIETI